MMRKRTRYSLLLMLALVVALVAAVWLRKTCPAGGRAPAAGIRRHRLPQPEAIARVATHFERTPVTRSPDYQHFVDATGIDPERDLDAAAFALHRMDNPNGPNGPVAYSEVFEGRFDGARLARYLAGMATPQEEYAGHTIYTIPIEGRTPAHRAARLRHHRRLQHAHPRADPRHARPLSRLGVAVFRLVAAGRALPRRASALQRLGHRPRRPPLFGARPHHRLRPRSFRCPRTPPSSPACATASARCTCASSRSPPPRPTPPAPPRRWTRCCSSSRPSSPRSRRSRTTADAEAMREFTASIQIEQHKDRAVLTANLPMQLLKKLVTPESAIAPDSSNATKPPASATGR